MDRQMRVAVVGHTTLSKAALSMLIADIGNHHMVDLNGSAEVIVIELDTHMSMQDELNDLGDKAPIVAILPGSDANRITDSAGMGVLSYVYGHSTPLVLEEAIQHALRGDRYICPRLAIDMIEETGPLSLSSRERQVLRFIALGLENAEVASEMHLSVRTVESHRSMVHKKLGAKKRRDLVTEAHAMGLV